MWEAILVCTCPGLEGEKDSVLEGGCQSVCRVLVSWSLTWFTLLQVRSFKHMWSGRVNEDAKSILIKEITGIHHEFVEATDLIQYKSRVVIPAFPVYFVRGETERLDGVPTGLLSLTRPGRCALLSDS